MHTNNHTRRGFTLIELLTVIGVLGILAGFLITNISGARLRAQDAKKKTELNSLKSALQLYYNKYQAYPPNPSTGSYGLKFMACGPNGTSQCPYSGCSADFASGGTDGCENVYVTHIEKQSPTSNYFFFKYYRCKDTDDFRAKVTLSDYSKSDSDITASQLRCPPETCDISPKPALSFGTKDFIICPN
ncbi:MAG: type II secretion system protein [bacterium]